MRQGMESERRKGSKRVSMSMGLGRGEVCMMA